ncbi:MAG: fused DSP-PTPase phosphatase/NAD kinase-like protein, partial [Bacteroidales bacterium]
TTYQDPMKRIASLLIFSLAMAISLHAQPEEKEPAVQTIHEFDNLYHYQHYYIAGQPSLDALRWLHEQGVEKVVNLRADWENEDFTSSSFNEEAEVEDLGMEYLSVPVEGRSGYSAKKLAKMAEFIDVNEPVLIHCEGAGRATNFLMAYLVKYKGYPLDKAVDVGKELTFFLALEPLLDEKIHMEAIVH